MNILGILVKLGMDATALKLGFKEATSIATKFGDNLKSAIGSKLTQALSVAALTGFAKHLMSVADEIKNLAEQMNLTTDQVQRLQILSAETGISFEKLSSVIKKFEEARLEATSGDQKAIDTFKKLGLSLDDLNDVQMQGIDGAIKAAIAHKNSGKSAETTAAMYQLYGTKLTAAATALADYKSTEGRELISEDTIKTLASANSVLDEQWRILKALASKPLADGLKITADTIKYLGDESTALSKAFPNVTPSQIGMTMLGNLPGAAAGIAVAAGNKPIPPAGPSPVLPPPIGQPEYERIKGAAFTLGGAQSDLARIGGFTGFQSAQDTAIRQAIEQTLQLKQIVKNTGKTADRISQE